MVRTINKVVAFILIGTVIGVTTPKGIFNIEVMASASDTSQINIDSLENNSTLSNSDEEALDTVESAMIPSKLSTIYGSSAVNSSTSVVSEYEECGNLSYTLDDTAAELIAEELTNSSNMQSIENGVLAVETAGNNLITLGTSSGSQALIQKGTKLKSSAISVLTQLQKMASMSQDELVTAIKSNAEDIPVYKYMVLNGTSTVGQGFSVGGILGLAVNPVDTYNATEQTGTYSSVALVPSLPLSGSSAYKKVIDLSESGTEVICDGVDINIIDSTNNKVYAINNPVYNMFEVSDGAENSTSGAKSANSKDILNVIDFSSVTNLKGFTSSIDLSSQGITTTILGLSLTTSNSTAKTYEYALPVEDYEKNLLDDAIDNMNLSTIGDTIKGMIKSGTYTMIPNISSNLSDTVSGVTDALDDISDSLDDLTDSINDKSDDVDDAWDKVFDRFDNDKGWGKHDGYRYYYDKDGVSLKGVQKISGKTYYFNRVDGAMETGWQIVDGKRCYFDKKKGYELFNQWIQDSNDWYYVDADGATKKSEWVNDGGKYYYLKSDGKMATDWFKIEDYWYYFNKNGSMVTSTWKWSDGKWYYLRDNGQAANDWFQIRDKWYYFKNPSGELQTGWFRANGNWYCSNDDGSEKTGWVSSSDGLCYLDETTGIMKKNEWITIDGSTYYFNVNGAMVTGSRYIDGTKYTFNSDGTLSS